MRSERLLCWASVDRQRLLTALAGLLSLATIGSEFEGCGDRERLPEAPLPESESTGCLLDENCEPDMCSEYACVFGECRPSRPRFDSDADGESAPPCGMDCDDSDPRVRPEQLEMCDGLDQDCDDVIDEDATGALYDVVADGLIEAEIVDVQDRFAVIGRDPDGALIGYAVSPDGAEQAPVVLVPADIGREVTIFDAAGGEQVAVVFARAGTAPELLLATLDNDDLVPSPPMDLGGSGETKGVAIHAHAGQTWVAFDTTLGVDTTRWLWRSGDGALAPLESSDNGPAIADDGLNTVVLDGAQTLSFLDPSAAEVGRQLVSGPVGAGHPLAGGLGNVVVVFEDAFDFLLTTATSSGTRSPTIAPSGDRNDEVGMYVVPEGVLFTRSGPQGPRVWIYEADFRSIIAALPGNQISPMAVGPNRMSVANNGADTLILSSYTGSSVLTFLECMSSP